MPNITLETVEAKRSKKPLRICFANSKNLKRSSNPDYVGSLSFPFSETIERLFKDEFPYYDFRVSQYNEEGLWRSIISDLEYLQIETWMELHKDKVFLRDCLDASFALSSNLFEPREQAYTELGLLERKAKYDQCEDSLERLVDLSEQAILGFQTYRQADFLCAVPPRKSKTFDLPSEIVERLSFKLGRADITKYFSDFDKSPSKGIDVAKKWEIWEQTGLKFFGEGLEGKSVILVDDLYQSGSTIQFVASVLQQAGAREVYGLSIVKSLRDSDNVR